jgi:hypothetical protein
MWPSDEDNLNQNETTCRPTNNWLTTAQAAKHIGVSPNALRIMVCREQVKCHKLGSRLKFRISDLDKLIQEKR